MSPYAYCNNNPLRFVDPDGKDWKDFVIGVSQSIVSNSTGGLAPTSTQNINDPKDYNLGRNIGDIVSAVVGVKKVITGTTQAVGGIEATIGSGGTSSAVSITGTVVGVVEAAHGGVITVTARVDYRRQILQIILHKAQDEKTDYRIKVNLILLKLIRLVQHRKSMDQMGMFKKNGIRGIHKTKTRKDEKIIFMITNLTQTIPLDEETDSLLVINIITMIEEILI